jgi:hypothetical protein
MARRATRQAEKPVAPPAPPMVRGKLAKAPPKAVQKPPKAVAKPDLDGMSADQKVTALLRDRDKLVARLHGAEARVAAMEAREEQLSDRIAWALDTLNDLLRLPDAP